MRHRFRGRGRGHRPTRRWMVAPAGYATVLNAPPANTISFMTLARTPSGLAAPPTSVPRFGEKYTVHTIRGEILVSLQLVAATAGNVIQWGLGIAKTAETAVTLAAEYDPLAIADGEKDWMWLHHDYFMIGSNGAGFSLFNQSFMRIPVHVRTKRVIRESELLGLTFNWNVIVGAAVNYSLAVQPWLRLLVGDAQ